MSENGRKLQSAAVIIGIVEILAVICIGIVLWVQLKGWIGLVSFIVTAGLGGLIAYTQIMLLSCVGEMTEYSAIQLNLLKQLSKTIADLNIQPAPTQLPSKDLKSDHSSKRIVSEQIIKESDTDQNPKKDRSGNILYFDTRSSGTVTCLMCGTSQDTTNNKCISCNCKFIYKDDPYKQRKS
jgi:hypothetical protein